MSFVRSSILPIRQLCLDLLAMLTLVLCSGCGQSLVTTYSIDEQFALSRARLAEMANKLQFSFKLDPDSAPIGQEIFFVATFTNTTDQSLVFRESKQDGVFAKEDYNTTLLFSVEPISKDLSLSFPGQGGFVDRFAQPVTLGEFVELPAHTSREIRLQLPHEAQVKHAPANVFAVFSAEYFPLPIGQYRVQMTYINDVIGYKIEAGKELRYVDLNAWVGKVEANPVVLTITPAK